jgi:hypothetical protein
VQRVGRRVSWNERISRHLDAAGVAELSPQPVFQPIGRTMLHDEAGGRDGGIHQLAITAATPFSTLMIEFLNSLPTTGDFVEASHCG